MNLAALHTPADFSKLVLALIPAAGNAPAAGPSIDRTGYLSVIFDVAFAFSGAPTGGTVTLQVQDSADGVSFTNYGAAVSAAITAANAGGLVVASAVDLGGARQYVRLTAIAAPTGGNAPTATLSSSARLFGPDRLPAI